MGTPTELAVMRALPAGEQMVAEMSMKEILQFEQSITNPAGIKWVGSDLYIVAPMASAPGPSALYGLDPTTSEAIILGSPRVGVLKEIIDPRIQIPTTPYYGEQKLNLTIER